MIAQCWHAGRGPWQVCQTVPALLAVAALALATARPAHARQEELIERTVAIVGGAVITLSDVRTALALGLVDPTGNDAVNLATQRLIERWLMLHEVARFAPPEPRAVDVEARVAAVAARAGSAESLADTLVRGAFTPARLATWVRDDLRIAAYLDQRFAVAGMPTDTEVAEYYRSHAVEFDRQGLTAAEATGVARARLLDERRRGLIADWLVDLRRRIEVVEFRH